MERLDELSLIVSECEKLRCTPLPLSYSRHTSRCDPPLRSAGPLFYACGGARGRDAANNGAQILLAVHAFAAVRSREGDLAAPRPDSRHGDRVGALRNG